jgi:excisionase family DNA binding protein
MSRGKCFLPVSEVAKQLCLSKARTYALVAEGVLPSIRRGRRVLVPAEAWERWLAKKTAEAMAVVSTD